MICIEPILPVDLISPAIERELEIPKNPFRERPFSKNPGVLDGWKVVNPAWQFTLEVPPGLYPTRAQTILFHLCELARAVPKALEGSGVGALRECE